MASKKIVRKVWTKDQVTKKYVSAENFEQFIENGEF